MARLVLIGGTGTSIGKTHVAEALLLGWRRTARVLGLKPIESGVVDELQSDASRLRAASSFHVKRCGYAFAAPLSPHLAARDEGVDIRVDFVKDLVDQARQQAQGVVVELPGGLFSPLSDAVCNADLAKALAPDCILLVAPDRLGVLHDVVATARAASTIPIRIDGVILVTPAKEDASTGRNARELSLVADVPVLAVLPRGTPQELSLLPQLQYLMSAIGATVKQLNT